MNSSHAKAQGECDSDHLHAQTCIPIRLQAPTLALSAVKPVTGDFPTIFVGMVDNKYTDDLWDNDMEQIGRLFQMTANCYIKQIKITRTGRLINVPEFGNAITEAFVDINSIKPIAIRIVGLGSRTTPFVTEALAQLIRGWDIPANQKEVQFITLGDSEDYHNLNFCKDLCLKEQCKTLHYFNTYDYGILGNLDSTISQ